MASFRCYTQDLEAPKQYLRSGVILISLAESPVDKKDRQTYAATPFQH
jgi:hypothetical protein